jgi:hypothetical protein
MEDGDLDESDEATDKIIQEMEAQKSGGNNGGGIVQSNNSEQNKVKGGDFVYF